MVKQYKIDEVEKLTSQLSEKGNIIFTNYSGINVKDLSDLRRKLREKNTDYKVVKNKLFKRALDNAGYSGLDEYLKGPIAVAFANDEVGEAAKVLKEFKDEVNKFSYSVGVIDKTVYNEEDIEKIAKLPSREVILGQIMSLANGPASGIAMGIDQVMASLARGINAVAEKNNG